MLASVWSVVWPLSAVQAPKPKRINRALELLEQDQPIYYAGSHSGTEGVFNRAEKMPKPNKDHILSRETARLVLIFRKESAD